MVWVIMPDECVVPGCGRGRRHGPQSGTGGCLASRLRCPVVVSRRQGAPGDGEHAPAGSAVGILGTGGIARQFTRDLLLAGHAVAAVGSRTRESAERFAALFELPAAGS